MRGTKLYNNWKDLLYKLASNLVSTKVWIATVASFALIHGDINAYVWAGIVGGLFGIRELVKPMILRSERKEDEE